MSYLPLKHKDFTKRGKEMHIIDVNSSSFMSI